MPELPEVEVARCNLTRWSEGRRIVGLRPTDGLAVRPSLSTSSATASDEALARLAAGCVGPAGEVLRRGKRLGWRLGGTGALVHLGMTGKWVRRASGEVPSHGRLGFDLDDGQTLWFVDPRRFGCIAPCGGDLGAAVGVGLGPDALEQPLDGPGLAAAMGGRGLIKVRLLDQTRLAGLGNIHAAEALFRAGIDPRRSAESLGPADWERLASAIVGQLRAAVDGFAAEEVTYLSEGASDDDFFVYGREGQACRACGAEIVRAVLGGRSTCWCPGCQPDRGGSA